MTIVFNPSLMSDLLSSVTARVIMYSVITISNHSSLFIDHYITNTLNFYVGDPNPTIMEEIPCGAKLFHFFELTGIFLANKGRHSSYNC